MVFKPTHPVCQLAKSHLQKGHVPIERGQICHRYQHILPQATIMCNIRSCGYDTATKQMPENPREAVRFSFIKTSLMFYSYRITITRMFSERYLAKNLPLSKWSSKCSLKKILWTILLLHYIWVYFIFLAKFFHYHFLFSSGWSTSFNYSFI